MGAEDFSRINSSQTGAAVGRLTVHNSTQVFSPHEVFKNLYSAFGNRLDMLLNTVQLYIMSASVH